MRLLKTICLTIVLSTSSAHSQEEKSSDSAVVVITKYGIGVKAGFNFATVSKGNLDNAPDARASIYVGANYEVPIIPDVFSVQPEVIYSQQGFEKRYTINGTRHKSVYKVNYLSVPVLARYYVVRGFSLEAGPQFSYKVNQKFNRDETDTEILTMNDANTTEFGFVAGLTFQFESGFFVNGRYYRSFKEIIPNSDAKNVVVQVGLGFKF